MRAIVLATLVLCPAAVAHAQSKFDAQVKNSFLALSAFECSIVSTDPKENERLFALGLSAGRQFLQFAQSVEDAHGKVLAQKIAVLWNLKPGPTPDFVLGRIYDGFTVEIYRDYATMDQKQFDMKRDALYRTKNCALLGK